MNHAEAELYRILKQENATYQDKLQTLWLQKFTLCGGLAAFFVLNLRQVQTVQSFSSTLIGLSLILVLSLAIDCKVLEYGLHTRVISRFIRRAFADEPRIAKWEAVLWGFRGEPEHVLVLLRSALTVIAAAIPTMAIVLLTSRMMLEAGFWRVGFVLLVVGVAYLGVVIASGSALL